MRKILLIGKLNKNLKDLYERLSKKFDVQVSVGEADVVEGMVEVVRPNMVLLNVMEYEDIDEGVLKALEKTYEDLPVLVFGTKNSCNRYKDFYEKKQFVELNRPVKLEILFKYCSKLIGEGGTETVNNQEKEDDLKKILVVDDSPITLRGIKAMLDKEFKVMVATSGEQALQMMKKKLPDLILLDYEMPGLDGRETLEQIRADEELCNIPVIFLTGVADKEHITAVLKLNPAGYFLKPAERNKLIGTIEELLYKDESI